MERVAELTAAAERAMDAKDRDEDEAGASSSSARRFARRSISPWRARRCSSSSPPSSRPP